MIRPFHRTTFRAFRQFESGRIVEMLVIGQPADAPSAVGDLQTRCAHKDKLILRETDEISGEVKLHLYAIRKRARPNYVRRSLVEVDRIQPLYAEPICTLYGPALTGAAAEDPLALNRAQAPALADEAAE